MIRNPPEQSPTMTISQYFSAYLDFMDMRGFLQNDPTNLNDKNELDQFIGGCTHKLRLFHISRDDRLSKYPIMLQRFVQGSLINTLTLYLRELKLIDGPTKYSSRTIEDSDTDSDDDIKPPSSGFRRLKTSSETSSLRRSGTSPLKKKRINHVAIDLNDPCASIVTPDHLVDHDILRVQM